MGAELLANRGRHAESKDRDCAVVGALRQAEALRVFRVGEDVEELLELFGVLVLVPGGGSSGGGRGAGESFERNRCHRPRETKTTSARALRQDWPKLSPAELSPAGVRARKWCSLSSLAPFVVVVLADHELDVVVPPRHDGAQNVHCRHVLLRQDHHIHARRVLAEGPSSGCDGCCFTCTRRPERERQPLAVGDAVNASPLR